MTQDFRYPSMLSVFTKNVTKSVNQPRFQRFLNFEPVPIVQQWWRSKAKVSALIGGNRSLKTTNCIVKAVMVFIGMIPPGLRDLYPWTLPVTRERHVRIIVHNYTKHWEETIMPFLVSDDFGFLPEDWSKGWDDETHIFTGPDNSTLSIVAVDPLKDIDPRVLRGPHIDHTMIDEITRQKIYEECVVRGATRHDSPNTVDLAFCPEEGHDWTYNEIHLKGYDRDTDEQLPLATRNPDFNIQRVTMFDNPYIDPEERDRIIAATPVGARPYKIYGRYTGGGESPYFPTDITQKWAHTWPWDCGKSYVIADKTVDVDTGSYTGRLQEVIGPETGNGLLNVWNVWEPPIEGECYMVSVDSAEGEGRGDFGVADVWKCSVKGKVDAMKARQVAQLRSRVIVASDFAVESLCMAALYGTCLYIFEINAPNGGTVRVYARYYPNVYHRIRQQLSKIVDTEVVGWSTDIGTKEPALSAARELVRKWDREGHRAFYSEVSSDEIYKFQQKVLERTKYSTRQRCSYGAIPGHFDDTVASFWMAAYVLTVQPYLLTPFRAPPEPEPAKVGIGWWEQQVEKAKKRQMMAENAPRRVPTLVQLYRTNAVKNGGNHGYFRNNKTQ